MRFSLCNLCVLCSSVVILFERAITTETEDTEIAQRKPRCDNQQPSPRITCQKGRAESILQHDLDYEKVTPTDNARRSFILHCQLVNIRSTN